MEKPKSREETPHPTIKPRSRAPEIELTAYHEDNDLTEIKLSNFPGQYVLLLFFPNGTPVCQTESVAFSEKLNKFGERGCQVLGLTVASPQAILGLKKSSLEDGGVKGIKFPILCDEDGSVCRNYGMLDKRGNAMRAFVILDKAHVIRHVTIYDRTVGRSVKVCLDIIDSYQENDNLQLGMPISWPSNIAEKMHKAHEHDEMGHHSGEEPQSGSAGDEEQQPDEGDEEEEEVAEGVEPEELAGEVEDGGEVEEEQGDQEETFEDGAGDEQEIDEQEAGVDYEEVDEGAGEEEYEEEGVEEGEEEVAPVEEGDDEEPPPPESKSK